MARLRTVVRAREVPILETERIARYELVLDCGHTTSARRATDPIVRRARSTTEAPRVLCTQCTRPSHG
jgi:hypothetical protein